MKQIAARGALEGDLVPTEACFSMNNPRSRGGETLGDVTHAGVSRKAQARQQIADDLKGRTHPWLRARPASSRNCPVEVLSHANYAWE